MAPALPPLRSPVDGESLLARGGGGGGGGAGGEGRHSASHPMQCILTRGAVDVFFAGDDGAMADSLQVSVHCKVHFILIVHFI